MDDAFPADVRAFIAEHISSIAELEMLLLLRSDPAKNWDVAEISKALYATPEMAAGQLSSLQNRGLLVASEEPENRYRYQPGSPELEGMVNRLAELYRDRRVSVITVLYSEPVNKVQTFADAFKLRKDT